MTKENLIDALNGIDADMVEEAEQKKPTKLWLRWAAAAAAVAMVIGIASLMGKNDSSVNDPPRIATMVSGEKLTGKQEFFYGEPNGSSGQSYVTGDVISPHFKIQSVLEVEVVEVLPGTYDGLYSSFERIAKLRVVDQIRGEGFPDEIFLQYYWFDEHIFDGYERFIISVQQIGVENFMMINNTERQVCYFSDMFSLCLGDLGYGSMIAFNNGRVDESFWDKTAQYKSWWWNPNGDQMFERAMSFPASRDSTIEEVKENILKQADDPDNWLVSRNQYDYVTADDIFTSEESRQIREYLSPDSKNVFSQQIWVYPDKIVARYDRRINGFYTGEGIVIDDGVVEKTGGYTDEELSRVPDIAQVMEEMNPKELQPPHVELEDGMELVSISGKGVYRKVDGKVYGIIRVVWKYAYSETKNCYIQDDCYYLYDADGNGRIVEREELRQIIGDDTIIANFSYGKYTVYT